MTRPSSTASRSWSTASWPASPTTGCAPARIIFTHAEVDDAYEGQGLASKLAQQSLDTARERGLAVIPACPFYAGYIQRHPAYVDLVPEDERAAYDL